MAKAPNDKDIRSPKRGAFPVPEDVLAAAPQYHPPERAVEPLPRTPEKPAPDQGAKRGPANRSNPEGEEEES